MAPVIDCPEAVAMVPEKGSLDMILVAAVLSAARVNIDQRGSLQDVRASPDRVGALCCPLVPSEAALMVASMMLLSCFADTNHASN